MFCCTPLSLSLSLTPSRRRLLAIFFSCLSHDCCGRHFTLQVKSWLFTRFTVHSRFSSFSFPLSLPNREEKTQTLQIHRRKKKTVCAERERVNEREGKRAQ